MAGLTPKQENFCRAYVETGNASEAYRRAYSAERMKPATVSRNAKRELDKNKIRARITELQAELQNRHIVTVDGLVRELVADRGLARGNDQAGAAMTATMSIARLHGLVDRLPPIDFPLPPIVDAASALAAMSKVIEGLTTGRLHPDAARTLSDRIERYRHTLETGELETRLREIERKLEHADR